MGLTLADIDDRWVASLCRHLRNTDEIQVRAFSLTELNSSQGVISRYQRSTREAIVGHHVLTVRSVARGEELEQKALLKSKVPGALVRRRLEEVYRKFDPRLAELQNALSPSILDDCHTRELAIYGLDHTTLRSITPAVGRVWIDETSQIFVIVMELLEDVRHENTLNDLDVWTPLDIEHVVMAIAGVHGEFLGQISAVSPPPWLVPFHQLNNSRLLEYQEALLRYNADHFPELFGAALTRWLEFFLDSAPERHRRIMNRPLTLIHGDFTPRNLCLKEMRLCAYDWELAQVHLPARDICEFFCYVLNPNRGWRDEGTKYLLDRYRRRLEEVSGTPISATDFHRDLADAIQEFCSFKLLVQGVTHQLLGSRYYFERLVRNAFGGIKEVMT